MNEPDLIQRLSADFNVVGNLEVGFDNVTGIDAQFGSVYVVEANNRVLYASTATWNSQPTLIGERGYIYIYSDWKQDGQGRNIAGFKIGDGNAYLIDAPFTDEATWEHIEDRVIHITQEEREKWNNKVTCYLSEVQDDTLIFSKN